MEKNRRFVRVYFCCCAVAVAGLCEIILGKALLPWIQNPDQDQEKTVVGDKDVSVPLMPTDDNRIAILFKTRNIGVNDICLCQRFLSISESFAVGRTKSTASEDIKYDIYLLPEPEESVNPALLKWTEAAYSNGRNDRIFVSKVPLALTYLNETNKHRYQSRAGKASFLLWIHELHAQKRQNYDHYWYIEDDVFWTGNWRHFFETNDNRLGMTVGQSPDFVSELHEKKDDYWKDGCRVYGDVCWDKKTKLFGKTYNNLFRMSDRLATHLLEMLLANELWGHHELNFIAALRHPNVTRVISNLTHAPLFADSTKAFEGLDTMGAWSVWTNKTGPFNTLRGLANVYGHEDFHHVITEMSLSDKEDALRNQSKVRQIALDGVKNIYKSNLDVPKNKIFHPVKCEAEKEIGLAALAFAFEENDLNSSTVQSLTLAGCLRPEKG